MSRLISFAVLIGIIIVIGLLFYRVLVGFFVPVFLAAVLVVVFRPLHRWVLVQTGHRDRVAAAVTTTLIMLALVVPVSVVFSTAAVQGVRLIKENENSAVIELRITTMRNSLGLQMPAFGPDLELVNEEIDEVVRNANEASTGAENAALQRSVNLTAKALNKLQQAVEAAEEQARLAALDGGEPAYDEPPESPWKPRFDQVLTLTESIGENSESAFPLSRKAVELKSDFGKLRTDLLGGPMRALAREYANPTVDDIKKLTNNVVDYVRPRLLSISGATGAFAVKLIFGSVILIVAIFFFLYDGPSMIKSVMYLSPLDDSYEQELLLEFDRISRAVVLATVLSAIVQGLTAGVGYYVAGMDYLMLLIMMTTVFAMVPFVGPAVVWVPVCLYLGLYEGRMLAAGVLAVWGVAVVGTVDNVVKAFVLHGQSQLHPLLALLSVLGGVQTLGPIGIVVGPMVVAMLQTLLGILQRELGNFEDHGLALSTGAGDVSSSTSSKRRKAATPELPEASPDEPPHSRAGGNPDESSHSRAGGNPAPATTAPPAIKRRSRRKKR